MPGIVTFLKKAGQIILTGVEIFSGIAPILTSKIPNSSGAIQTVSKDLAQVAGVVMDVEAFGQALGLPGAQKLQAAVGPVSQIILDSSLLAGKTVADPALFKQGAQKVADGLADVLNSIHPDNATQVKPQDVKSV